MLAVAWAVYLIPKALKHHDEVARTRSIDRFSTAMRVLARREPVSSGDTRLVVTPARAADNPRVVVPVQATRTAPTPARPGVQRAAARAAARRRRRILSVLLLSTLVVAGLAAFAVVPWWSVSIPAGLTVLFLVLARTQVRRARTAAFAPVATQVDEASAPAVRETRPAARVEAPYGTPLAPAAVVRNAQGFDEYDPNEDTIAIPVPVLDAAGVETLDGGTLWDPLPVTLPTYVTKPKARRTVRTIDLGEPGTWTSGRTAEDAELAAGAAQQADEQAEVEPRRAVGS